ncbi:MAG TPA: serine hydrolase [Anaerolineales bacterium]|nr:serine hydrolase [Anaerolineales bacterium]
MKYIKKILAYLLGLAVGLVVLFIVWASVTFRPDFVMRLLRWGNADVADYQKFPARVMAAADEPFLFPAGNLEAEIRQIFESHPLVDDLDTFLEENGTQAFLVIYNGELVLEAYYNGVQRDSIVTSFSAAKSYGSTLIGIAIDEGYIQSVDDPITDYLPELAERDPAFSQITIRDLLRMSSGIRYKELPSLHMDDATTYYYPDLRWLALNETEILDPSGEYMLYNNFHPLLIGMILERATGQHVADYLAAKIWRPMGAEYDGSWSLDSEETAFEKMESGINGRAIDFAKFGLLVLNNGEWNGKQLIPAAWLVEATQDFGPSNPDEYYPDYFSAGNFDMYYNYMWWGFKREGGDDFSAMGNFGQYIYISPSADLLIVRNGERYGVEFLDWPDIFYHVATELGNQNP